MSFKSKCSKVCVLRSALLSVTFLAMVMMILGLSSDDWVAFRAHVRTEAKNQTISFHLGLWTTQGCMRYGVFTNCYQDNKLWQILKALEDDDEIPDSKLAYYGYFNNREKLQVLTSIACSLCLLNIVTVMLLFSSQKVSVIIASVVHYLLSVAICFTAGGFGIEQYITTSMEMDVFNNERYFKDIIVEMSVPISLIEVGVGAVLEIIIAAFSIHLAYHHRRDGETRDPSPTIDCRNQKPASTTTT